MTRLALRLCPSFGLALLLAAAACGCASPAPAAAVTRSDRLVAFVGARGPDGEPLSFLVRDGRFLEVDPSSTEAASETVDLAGTFVVPAVVDSHVHLAFFDVADQLVAAGVAGAVDLAAPLPLPAPTPGLEVAWAGPMITAVRGYPTQSWGRGGYGAECATPAEAVEAVKRAFEAGARVVKVPLGQGPQLDDETVERAVEEAHTQGMKVAVHALSDAAALRARQLGADVLAHTPVEPLGASTVAAWSDGAVISTLGAFGGSAATVDNLRRLREAGATVLYGTDLGNTRDAGIQAEELDLLRQAGLDDRAVLRAMTTAPSAYWGLEVGRIEAGAKASFLALSADPSRSVEALLAPQQVFSHRPAP